MRTTRSPRQTLTRRLVVAYGGNAKDWATNLVVEREAAALVATLSDHQVQVALRSDLRLTTVKETA